jgi:energy-coupling factor transporter ATP-binding protein EcfA2
MELAKVKNVANRWLYLEDDTYIDVVLATVVAHGFDGDPLWLMLIGASGSGKSEILRALTGERVYHLSNLTPQTLVSGLNQRKGDPSLLPDINGRVVVMKDLTTLLSENAKDRSKIFGQLRDLYDGFTSKAFGSGVGRRAYGCHVGFIAGVTPAIERFQAMDQALGERFLNYRLEPTDADRQVEKAMDNADCQETMRSELKQATHEFLDQKWPVSADTITIPKTYIARIRGLAVATSQLRTQVPKTRAGAVTFIPEPEVGTRLAVQLTKLARALTIVRGISTFSESEYELVQRVAADSIPSVRFRLVRALAQLSASGAFVDTAAIAERSLMPLHSARVGLEDLRLLRLAESAGSSPLRWRLSPALYARLATADFILSENTLPLSVVQMHRGARS